MGELIHLVRVFQDKHGDIKPVKNEHCPFYKKHLIEPSCMSDGQTLHCSGLSSKAFIKDVKDKPWELIRCDFENESMFETKEENAENKS